MSDLLSLLTVGASAITATNASIAITTNNVANVNTPGYSKERVGDTATGSAVRLQDPLLAARIQAASSSLAMSQAFSSALSQLESAVAGGDGTMDEQLGALFLKVGQASASPADQAARDAVVAAARDLVASIQRRSASVAATRADADSRIRTNAAAATGLAKQLAAANTAVAKSSGDPTALDQRDQLAKQLGQLVGGAARIDKDGQMRYVLDGGAVLVDGSHAAQLTTTPDATTGYSKVEVVDGAVRRDVTSAISGGSIGADLKFRDQNAAQTAAQIDQFAFDVTTSVNAVHTQNAGLDGVTGRPMFTPVTQVAGAAQAMAVDPALAADSKLLALAAPGSGPGDNTGALALFGLANQTVASGGTATLGDAALDVVSHVATASADAKNDTTRDGLVNDNLAGLRDSLSGVDTQEELTDLARFEHASTAMGKVVSTLDTMLGTLIDSL